LIFSASQKNYPRAPHLSSCCRVGSLASAANATRGRSSEISMFPAIKGGTCREDGSHVTKPNDRKLRETRTDYSSAVLLLAVQRMLNAAQWNTQRDGMFERRFNLLSIAKAMPRIIGARSYAARQFHCATTAARWHICFGQQRRNYVRLARAPSSYNAVVINRLAHFPENVASHKLTFSSRILPRRSLKNIGQSYVIASDDCSC